jgi:uncharacterized protein YdeI (YjbR/CyaY-like superfamily)
MVKHFECRHKAFTKSSRIATGIMTWSEMMKTENFVQVEITSAAELRAWLEVNHAQRASVWLLLHKKHTGSKYVSINEILDELLCFGWVDGIARKVDENRSLRLISPRRTQRWAKTYKDRVERLTREGRMHSSGLEGVAAAKQNGLWNAMDDVDALEMPDDLLEALKTHAPAETHFAAFPTSLRRNVLRWIKIAKTPQTRAKRIETTAVLAVKNEKVPQM